MKSRCSVALDSTNISKNRYTDVLPSTVTSYNRREEEALMGISIASTMYLTHTDAKVQEDAKPDDDGMEKEDNDLHTIVETEKFDIENASNMQLDSYNPIPLQIEERVIDFEMENIASMWVHLNVIKLSQESFKVC
ncbi:hypothetical protein HAX54_047024 [Datura stramonium]|uniref:Uncharacterized protein n=1 Tax=Datura stramonium TaxID=4076 RepID=A0ABS8SSK4_DATST|nr:hypothetical protein [Datura stramonium]